MTFTIRALAVALAIATLGAGSQAQADEGENAIKYRQAMMKAVGGHMGGLAAIISGKVAHKGDLKAHAAAMAALADMTAHGFPEGSDFGVTAAKAEVWDKPAEFKKAVTAFQAAAAAMVGAADKNDMKAAGAALKQLGGACKGCHEAFREKKQ